MTNEQCTEMMSGMMGGMMNCMMDGNMMGGMMNGMMDGNMMGGMMNGMMGPMMLGMLLFWTLVIVALVLLVRLLWGRRAGSTSSGISILQERFARGEMDREEYQERLSTLLAR